jgi:hypothetical protein
MALALLGALFLALSALAACGTPTGQPLRDIHADYDFDSAPAVSDALCENCHNIESVTESTRDYGGQIGLSIHEPPEGMPFGDCKSCHQLDSPPLLSCNQAGCHDFDLPEGWRSTS